MNRLAALIMFLPYLAVYVLLGQASNTPERDYKTALARQLERSSTERRLHAPLGIRLTPVTFSQQSFNTRERSSSSKATERELRHAIDRMNQAFQHRDRDGLAPLLTPDYLHINGSDGTTLDRTRWLERIDSEQRALHDQQLTIDHYGVSGLIIRMHGSSAFVSAVETSSGTRNGQPFTHHSRVSHLWVLADGQWRRAGFHDALLDTM
ncbi:MAG: nuclear transport factor 2 family protein [Pseudomonadota bacterium]